MIQGKTKLSEHWPGASERVWLYLVSALLFIVLPFFAARVFLALFLVYNLFNQKLTLTKENAAGLLLFFFCLAYIFSPYAVSFDGLWQQGGAVILLFCIGVFWALGVSSDIKLPSVFKDRAVLGILALCLLGINWAALHADIAFRGDEDFHIRATVILLNFLTEAHLWIKTHFIKVLAGALAVTSAMFLANVPLNKVSNGRFWLQALFLGVLSLVVVGFFQVSSEQIAELHRTSIRYSLVQKWFNWPFVLFNRYGDIAAYRAVPFISTVLLGWYLYEKLKRPVEAKWLAAFLALAVITIPGVYFFSNILYLEMPIVLLMTICVFHLRELMTLEFAALKREGFWTAFVLLGFLKETTLAFLVIVLGLRFCTQVYCSRRWKTVFNELQCAFLALLPLAIYLFFRLRFLSSHQYGTEFGNVFALSNTIITVQALVKQWGVIFFLGLAGGLYYLKKDLRASLCLFLIVIGTHVFFVNYLSAYVGNARWNLFLLPVFLFLSVELLKKFNTSLKIIGLLIILVFNVALSPIHLNGVRRPNWGSPASDGNEHTYPYDKTVKYLKEEGSVKHVLLTGLYYEYFIDFYFHKYDFHPQFSRVKFDTKKFDAAFERDMLYSLLHSLKSGVSADLATVDTIIYHSVNNIDLVMDQYYFGVFQVVKKISNQEHSIYVIKR